MKQYLIDSYCDYQEIKASLKEPNPVLDYKIVKVKAKLEAFSVNVEDLTFTAK